MTYSKQKSRAGRDFFVSGESAEPKDGEMDLIGPEMNRIELAYLA